LAIPLGALSSSFSTHIFHVLKWRNPLQLLRIQEWQSQSWQFGQSFTHAKLKSQPNLNDNDNLDSFRKTTFFKKSYNKMCKISDITINTSSRICKCK
jgi:hypothetical protein